MKKELVKELFEKFESSRCFIDGIECWSARNLQIILGYSEWRNFRNSVEKAVKACANAGENINDHFVDVNKMVELGSGGQREIDDIALTRYACYLTAQNGDPSKPEVAFAQTYFAFKQESKNSLNSVCLILQEFLQEINFPSQKKSFQE